MSLPPKILVFLLAASLTGCANWNSVFRNRMVVDEAYGKQAIVTIDAKQRAILTALHGTGSDMKLRLCAEQAPDIFSVLSSNTSGEVTGDASTQNYAAKVALAAAESGGAIERSQTVNLLAMSMYRTCERFLNGEIGRTELNWQAARDQRMLVSVLAIEQLTNMVHPKIARPPTSAGGSAGGTAAAYVEQLSTAKSKWEVAEKAKEVAAAGYAAALGKAPEPTAGKERECAAITDRKDKELCETKKNELLQRTEEAERQRNYYDAILKQAGSVALAVQGVGNTSSPVNVSVTLGDAAVKEIANTVLELAKIGVSLDYVMELCLHALATEKEWGESKDTLGKEMLREYVSKFCGDITPQSQPDVLANVTVPKASSKGGGVVQIAGRIYPQVATDEQRRALDRLLENNKDHFPGATIYRSETINKYTGDNVVRYFFEEDGKTCEGIAKALESIGLSPITCHRVRGYESKTKPRLYEIWLGPQVGIPANN